MHIASLVPVAVPMCGDRRGDGFEPVTVEARRNVPTVFLERRSSKKISYEFGRLFRGWIISIL